MEENCENIAPLSKLLLWCESVSDIDMHDFKRRRTTAA
jgi:hypothetical protein